MPPATSETGLYRDAYERDSCGFGLIASLDDQPSHWLVQTAISSLNRLPHRGAIATDGKTGDGGGRLLQRPERFLRAGGQHSQAGEEECCKEHAASARCVTPVVEQHMP